MTNVTFYVVNILDKAIRLCYNKYNSKTKGGSSMRSLLDKILIIACCCLFCGRSAIDVTAVLVAAALSSLCQYSGKSKISLVSQLVYGLLCIAEPSFLCALPIIIYDIYSDKMWISGVLAAIGYSISLTEEALKQPLIIPIFCGLSMLLCHRTTSYEKLYENYIKTVDTSAEMTNLLRENNMWLIENQNYEIRLATLNERNRIAREIHDNVGHLLSRSILQVQALKLIPDNDLKNEGLSALGESLGTAMTSIRKSVHDLHDDSAQLDIAIREAVRPLQDKGITVKYICDESEDMPNRIKMSFISIIKEAVNNIIKHSSADTAYITFREQPAFYQLIIEDNGKCPEAVKENGIGLSNMRSRIDELGGIINISAGEKGFRIFITVKKR